MLDELHVRDLALIEEAWLEFGPGMTALTGETGAGKTALLGALKLLLGDRADSGSVRAGAAEALAEGRFASADGELLVRRRVSADGRSRCALDGEMATVGALAERIGPLVDLHGQHDHQALLVAANHVAYLDARAGATVALALSGYRAALARFATVQAEYVALEERLAVAAAGAQQLRFTVADISRVTPLPDEDAEIEARLPALAHAERLSEAASEAVQLLRGDGAAADRIARAQEVLGKVDGIDPRLDALQSRLGELSALADDLGTELRAYRDDVEHDPAGLDVLQARLSELHGLMRKYGPRLSDVMAAGQDAEGTLADFDAGDELLAQQRAVCSAAEDELREAARELDDARREAAPGFERELAEAAAELAMGNARFEVAFAELPLQSWNAAGPARIEFLFASAADQPVRPLTRIASGGELSRVMLALKGVLGEADAVETLVFDEIDAGIGGATAHTVGRRLARLAQTHQVIVVTHLAQVAAYADAQLVVRKSGDAGSSTTVERVEGDDRVAEIARMLSGNDSDVSVAHARELLGEASRAAEPLV